MHNNLPTKYYFINKFDTNYIDKQQKNTAIIYRNYTSKNNLDSILKLKAYCKNKGYKFFLSNNIKLAINLNLDGAYIPSFNNNFRHLNYQVRKNFIVIGSAHNIKEIRIKELQKTNLIFLSSIFKKNRNYLGINKFNNIKKITKTKIVALGGVSEKNIKKLKLLNCFGFAGISYFK